MCDSLNVSDKSYLLTDCCPQPKQIESIFTYIVFEWKQKGSKQYSALLGLYVIIYAQMYLMMGLSTEYTAYMDAERWRNHNAIYLCNQSPFCIGQIKFLTYVGITMCLSIIILQVLNKYEEIRISTLLVAGIPKNFGLQNWCYYIMIKLTEKMRIYYTLVSVINASMNMFCTDIGIPSIVLNGLSVVFVLNVEDLIFSFYTGSAYDYTTQMYKPGYDRMLNAKKLLFWFILIMCGICIFVIINDDVLQYNLRQSHYDQILILSCNGLIIVLFFLIDIFLDVKNNADYNGKHKIINVFVAEILYVGLVFIMAYPIILELLRSLLY